MFPSFGSFTAEMQKSQLERGHNHSNTSSVGHPKEDTTVDMQAESVDTVSAQIEERKSKLRRILGGEIMELDIPSSPTKKLHARLLKPTPTKSVDTTIRDAIALGYNTPTTRRYLEKTYL